MLTVNSEIKILLIYCDFELEIQTRTDATENAHVRF